MKKNTPATPNLSFVGCIDDPDNISDEAEKMYHSGLVKHSDPNNTNSV